MHLLKDLSECEVALAREMKDGSRRFQELVATCLTHAAPPQAEDISVLLLPADSRFETPASFGSVPSPSCDPSLFSSSLSPARTLEHYATTPSRLSRSITSGVYPSAPSVASVSAPSSGAKPRTFPWSPLTRTGDPTVMSVP